MPNGLICKIKKKLISWYFSAIISRKSLGFKRNMDVDMKIWSVAGKVEFERKNKKQGTMKSNSKIY